MDSDCSAFSDDSESFIPSSNFEPPPPVDCILQKSHICVDKADRNKSDRIYRRSRYCTQPDEFEDIQFQLTNPVSGDFSPSDGDIASPGTFGSDKCFRNPHSSLQDNLTFGSQNSTFSPAKLASSSKISENSENVDPKRSGQLQKLLSPALSSRASVPSTIPTKVAQVNLVDFRSQVNTEFSSIESLNSISHVTGTNTTVSTRTTRSGSDLFKTDSSSAFREPLVPPRRRNVTSTSTNTTNYEENDNLPAFSYTLSLAIQRLPAHIEKPSHVEFKAPDFAKTITWQSRVRRREESAAASISIAAGVLADSFSDWIRESLLSDSDESHRGCSCAPTTLVKDKLNVDCCRTSYSSSEYFVPRTVIPESSDLDAQCRFFSCQLNAFILADTVLASMGRSNGTKGINLENNSRASTSSSEYFLPWKATSCKRKLNESAKDIQGMSLFVFNDPEGALSEANIGTQTMTISSNAMDAQNRTSTSSSEYLIPVKKSAMRMARSANGKVAVIDAVEMDSQVEFSEKSSESVILLQHQEPSVTTEKHSESSNTSISSNQETREPETNNPSQNGVRALVSNTPKSPLRSIRNRRAKSTNTTADASQQEIRGDYSLRLSRQIFSSDGLKSQRESTGSQTLAPTTVLEETPVMISQEVQTEAFSNPYDDSSDTSTVVCKQESLSPICYTELVSSLESPEPVNPGDNTDVASSSRDTSANRTESAGNRSAKTKKATLKTKLSTPRKRTNRLEISTAPQEDRINNEGEEERNEAIVNKLRSASRRTAPTTPVKDSSWKLGMCVYAKWWDNNNYIAGKIAKSLGNGKFEIEFEDSSIAEVTGRNVILTELLPIGTEVLVDINGTGAFKIDGVVLDHVVGAIPPSYIVKQVENGEVTQVPRSRVAINLTKLKKLLATEQISTIIKWASLDGRDSSALNGSLSSVKTGQLSAPATGSRSASRTNQRRKKSYKRVRERTSTELSTKTKKRSVTISAKKQTSKRQTQRKKLRSGSINRRDSQIWLTGRRIVTRASRTSVLLGRKRVSLASPTFEKRRKVSQKTNTHKASVRAPLSPPTIKVNVGRRPSNSRFSSENVKGSSAVDLDLDTFRQMCRKYDIPVPQPDLFSCWAFILTTGAQSSQSNHFNLDSNDPIARKQSVSVSENSFFLQKIISAGGGRDVGEHLSEISPNGCLVEEMSVTRRHIALVAPAACRTVRYLQALATLGRVPQVHRVWILDACLIAAGRSPIVTPPEVVAKISNTKVKTPDIPMALLRHSSRGLFELPRGMDKIQNTLVPPSIFPRIFAEPGTVSPPKTLLELGGYASATVVAIVTNDFVKFGSGWLSILRHALFDGKSTELPIILSPVESLHELRKIRVSPLSSVFGYDLKIVLADQDRIPEPAIAEIRNMGFVVVNKEFMIQSLINGKMLDLKYATAWRN